MAIRSLRDTWIDANFKETQLRNLRIGQRVAIEADITAANKDSKDAFPVLLSAPAQPWRCCRLKTRPVIS
jgi:Multidrug resistance efflux pump